MRTPRISAGGPLSAHPCTYLGEGQGVFLRSLPVFLLKNALAKNAIFLGKSKIGLKKFFGAFGAGGVHNSGQIPYLDQISRFWPILVQFRYDFVDFEVKLGSAHRKIRILLVPNFGPIRNQREKFSKPKFPIHFPSHFLYGKKRSRPVFFFVKKRTGQNA